MSLRSMAATTIRDLMPEHGDGYAINDAHGPLGQIDQPTISVLLKGYRHADLDSMSLIGEFLVTIASPWLDVEHAEDDLDTDVAALLLLLDAHELMTWTTASRSIIADKYHGWDINVELLCKITSDPDPDQEAHHA